MFEKLRGSISAVLLKCFQIAEATELVDEGILIILLPLCLAYQTGSGNKFYINLSLLARVLHLFVRFCHIFGIWQLYGCAAEAAQHTVQAGDGSGVTPLPEFDPEHHQTGVGVPAAHIPDEFDLIGCVLLWVAVRAVRAVSKGLDCAVILLTPAVDVLTAGFVTDGCFCHAIFQGIFNYHLLKPHVLCYLIHSE